MVVGRSICRGSVFRLVCARRFTFEGFFEAELVVQVLNRAGLIFRDIVEPWFRSAARHPQRSGSTSIEDGRDLVDVDTFLDFAKTSVNQRKQDTHVAGAKG